MFDPNDLLYFLEKNRGVFTNRNGICFEMITEEYFRISTPVPHDKYATFRFLYDSKSNILTYMKCITPITSSVFIF